MSGNFGLCRTRICLRNRGNICLDFLGVIDDFTNMDNYKKQISDRLKQSISDWIAQQKTEHPDQLLRSNWKILFPKGFIAGQNTIPVMTPAKGGKRLIAEIGFYLQDDLVLNVEETELTLKNELYREKRKKKSDVETKSIDSSLDVINHIILGASDIMASLSGISTPEKRPQLPKFGSPTKASLISPIVEKAPTDEVTKAVRLMLVHPDLPEYVKTIQDKTIRDRLLEKMSEAYLHYSNTMGRNIDLSEFFDLWTKQLDEQGRIHTHCKWKGIPITLDNNGWCTEYNCSKLPYRSKCPQSTYKFGRSDKI